MQVPFYFVKNNGKDRRTNRFLWSVRFTSLARRLNDDGFDLYMDSENDIHLLKAVTPFQRLRFQNDFPAPPESFLTSYNSIAGADYSVARSFLTVNYGHLPLILAHSKAISHQ
jgi:hypothetical protein